MARSVTGRDRMHLQNLLVTAEFALALTLLGGEDGLRSADLIDCLADGSGEVPDWLA
jgi:hypothetical protein